jgi:serine/threonine protein kinase
MTVPLILFKHIARASLNQIGGGILGEIVFNIADDVMGAWRAEKDERSRKEELEAIAQATTNQIKVAVREVVESVASDRIERDQEAIATYLMHVPGAIRRTLRRASDPSGRTLPSGFAMKDAGDLAAILPQRLPRFRPGDKPWANVDRQLVELLGVGGFGEVWKATNPRRQSFVPVALKFCIDPASRDKLLGHEASIIDRIMDVGPQPGIVRLNETYLTADPPCLEYEFVDGGELTGIIQDFHSRGGISPGGAAKIVERLAKTVGFFHRLQPPIVHRDLKPANILVKSDATGKLSLKIADFGISGLAAGLEIERSQTQAARGGLSYSISRGSYTPLYASPEQMRGAPPDPRDDVHALGVIWFQLLSGDPALGPPTGMDWIEDLMDRGMSHDQIRVLASCFSSKLAKRPADAECLAAEIRTHFPPKQTVAEVAPSRSVGDRVEDTQEAVAEVAPSRSVGDRVEDTQEAVAEVAPSDPEVARVEETQEAVAEFEPSESDGDRTEEPQETVAEIAPSESDFARVEDTREAVAKVAPSESDGDEVEESQEEVAKIEGCDSDGENQTTRKLIGGEEKLKLEQDKLDKLYSRQKDLAEKQKRALDSYESTIAGFDCTTDSARGLLSKEVNDAHDKCARLSDLAYKLEKKIAATSTKIKKLQGEI